MDAAAIVFWATMAVTVGLDLSLLATLVVGNALRLLGYSS